MAMHKVRVPVAGYIVINVHSHETDVAYIAMTARNAAFDWIDEAFRGYIARNGAQKYAAGIVRHEITTLDGDVSFVDASED